jgi:hypothetical protein
MNHRLIIDLHFEERSTLRQIRACLKSNIFKLQYIPYLLNVGNKFYPELELQDI